MWDMMVLHKGHLSFASAPWTNPDHKRQVLPSFHTLPVQVKLLKRWGFTTNLEGTGRFPLNGRGSQKEVDH
jgi:hypothetical protein